MGGSSAFVIFSMSLHSIGYYGIWVGRGGGGGVYACVGIGMCTGMYLYVLSTVSMHYMYILSILSKYVCLFVLRAID